MLSNEVLFAEVVIRIYAYYMVIYIFETDNSLNGGSYMSIQQLCHCNPHISFKKIIANSHANFSLFLSFRDHICNQCLSYLLLFVLEVTFNPLFFLANEEPG